MRITKSNVEANYVSDIPHLFRLTVTLQQSNILIWQNETWFKNTADQC